MKLVLLPGNSKRNKEWIEALAKELGDLFTATSLHFYRHWETGEEIVDVDYELKQLSTSLAKEQEYVIIAKSIGAALALKGIKEGKISPKKCIFLGLPVRWCRAHDIPLDSWIQDYALPTLFIQNSGDPALRADDLKEFLNEKSVKNYLFIKIEGNSHDYPDLEKIKNLVKAFIKK